MKYLQLDGSFPNTVFKVMSRQNSAEYPTPPQNVKELVSKTCSSQVPTSSQTLLGSFYAFVRKCSQFQPTSKECTCVSIRPQDRQFLRFLWGTDDPEMYEYVRHAMSSGQNARLPALITLFRHAPKTTHLTTRPFSASFTKVFIWMTFTYLQTPSQKPSST